MKWRLLRSHQLRLVCPLYDDRIEKFKKDVSEDSCALKLKIMKEKKQQRNEVNIKSTSWNSHVSYVRISHRVLPLFYPFSFCFLSKWDIFGPLRKGRLARRKRVKFDDSIGFAWNGLSQWPHGEQQMKKHKFLRKA